MNEESNSHEYEDHCCGDCALCQTWTHNPHKGNCPYRISWFWITDCVCNKFSPIEEQLK